MQLSEESNLWSRDLPHRLRQARKRARLSQSGLGSLAGLSRCTVHAIESGMRLGNTGARDPVRSTSLGLQYRY